MKHLIILIISALAFIASVMIMLFKLNILMVFPALIAFQVADNAYESLKKKFNVK